MNVRQSDGNAYLYGYFIKINRQTFFGFVVYCSVDAVELIIMGVRVVNQFSVSWNSKRGTDFLRGFVTDLHSECR